MARLPRPALALTALALATTLTTPTSAWARDDAGAAAPTATTAPAPRPTTVTVTLARRTAPIGKKVVLSGAVTGGRRAVELQTRDSRGRWRTLTTRTSSADGRFRLPTPAWHRTHPLRVRVLASSTGRRATSKVVKLKRTVPRTTGGRSSSWRPIRSRSIRWDPCRTYDVRVNTRGAPRWFVSEVKSALRNIRLHTGIEFTYAGKTLTTSNGARTDLLVRWTDAGARPVLGGSTAGVGISWTNGRRIVGGTILLDRREKVSRNAWRAVLRHELAHVVGLDHVNDRTQRMHPQTYVGGDIALRSRTWGRGDVTGLKQMGAAHGCIG